MKYWLAAAAPAAAIILAATTAGAFETSAKPTIKTASDLPPVRFTLKKAPSASISGDDVIALLPSVRREGERLLSDYVIEDKTVTQGLRLGLANIAVLEGRKEDAARLLRDYRANEAKPQRQLLGALATDLATVMLDQSADRKCSAAAAHVRDLLAKGDPALVRDMVLNSYSDFQIASVPFFASVAAGLLDPTAEQRKSLDVLQMMDLIRWRVVATNLPLCRGELSAAVKVWIDAPANRAVDIWPTRQPTDDALARAKPVVVAVWDSGYDATLFPGQLARDPAEPLDGRDNDGNGVADDWNGPTYDVALNPRVGSIMPPTEFLRRRLAAQTAYDKGELDLKFGLNTPEAALFAAFARTAGVEEQTEEFLAQMENRGRSHGTACASEIADGAPYVRLYNIAALPWGRGEDKRDIAYDEKTIARWAAAIDRIGPRIRGAGVRVVSMSWGLTADEITQQLLDSGLETDQVKARARGLAMRQTIADALRRLMVMSPNTLFVVAAGNSDQAGDVQADAASTLTVPNMVIVGATGTSGRPTAFTVYGDGVSIYAQGEAVPLRWPGNILWRASGTSMAAPLVARAAAQMLAINPKLSGSQTKAGLLASATVEAGGLKLLHPANALRWARLH